jgi:asparagine synthase (glutamine-hydrolysing)
VRGIDRLRDFVSGEDEYYVRQMTHGLSTTHRAVFTPELAARVATDPARVAAPFLSAVRGMDVLSRRQYLDTHTYLPGDILTKVDRASMMVSLESRAPLLDHVLAEFAATIPADLRMKGMTTKYILKKVAERLMPAELVHRPKMGFGIPVTAWLRGEWAERSGDLVLGKRARARGIFREDFLRRVMDEHRAGRRDHASMIWTLMMLEMWFREKMD